MLSEPLMLGTGADPPEAKVELHRALAGRQPNQQAIAAGFEPALESKGVCLVFRRLLLVVDRTAIQVDLQGTAGGSEKLDIGLLGNGNLRRSEPCLVRRRITRPLEFNATFRIVTIDKHPSPLVASFLGLGRQPVQSRSASALRLSNMLLQAAAQGRLGRLFRLPGGQRGNCGGHNFMRSALRGQPGHHFGLVGGVPFGQVIDRRPLVERLFQACGGQ